MNPWPLTVGMVLTAAAVAAALAADGYQAYVLGMLGLTTMVGVGLNMLMGLTGQISIGHSAFYAIGAYAGTLMVSAAGLSFWWGLLAGGVASGLVGGLISVPVSRLSGPYIAMVTIAFAFVVENGIKEWDSFTGGSSGVAVMAPVNLAGWSLDTNGLAALIAVSAALSMLAFWALKVSRWGLAMRAVRDSAVAASALGISSVAAKAMGFGLSAALAAAAGAYYGPLAGFINPESFPLTTSIIFVLVVMAGGTGTVAGPLLGAAVAVLVPELLAGLEAYRLLFVGLLLWAILLAAPRGIVGSVAALMPRRDRDVAADRALDLTAFLAEVPSRRLDVSGLSISFGNVRAVSDVAFSAEPGRVTSLIGPNGAGKTTVLNLISGFYQPDGGAVRLGDADVTSLRGHHLARGGIARTFQTAQLFDELSVADNLRVAMMRGRPGMPFRPYARSGPGAPDMARVEGLLAFVGYRGGVERMAGDLPHVDRRLVEIARALAMRPSVLLLDEPAAGLNGDETSAVAALIRRVADAGVTVLVVEHDMGLVMGISDRVVVLDSGEVIADGVPDAVRQDERVRAAYLGEGGALDFSRDRPWAGERDSVLNVAGLTAGYGAAPAIEEVGFHLNSGEMLAVLGANGAGKSTTMKTVAGLMQPAAGTVQVQGRDLTGAPASVVARSGVVLVPEGRQVFPELSVRDNLLLGAYSRGGVPDEERLQRLLDRFPVLGERATQRAGLLSGGEQQMLAIARGLMAEPKVLLLDEPSLGLAPSLIESLYGDLADLRDEGVTIVLVDQMAEMALSLVDRGVVLGSGRVVASGDADTLARSGTLSAAYLGGAETTEEGEDASATRTHY